MPAEVVIVVTVLILVVMFSAQRYGTDFVGAAFAPILVIWLLAIAGTPALLLKQRDGMSLKICM